MEDNSIWESYQSLVQQARIYTSFYKKQFGNIAIVEGLLKEVTPNIVEKNKTESSDDISNTFSSELPETTIPAEIKAFPNPRIDSPQNQPLRASNIVFSVPPLEERKRAMELIVMRASQCTLCTLSRTRTQVVFSSGPVSAKIAVIGEAPGKFEDIEGVPFIGPAGELLTKMLAGIKIKREEVYITNVVKCRPIPIGIDTHKENRPPTEQEIQSCSIWFNQQFHYVRPLAILGMGATAVRGLIGRQQSISSSRLKNHPTAPFIYRGIPVIFTYHPSYLLRNPEAKKEAWRDLLILQEVMKNFSSQ